MLLTAMILMCAAAEDGPYCTSVVSPILAQSPEECLRYLETGIQLAEANGWTVMQYDCYNWSESKKLSDLFQQEL